MDDISITAIWKAVRIAGRVLNDRIVRLLALVMVFALFTIAILKSTWIALAVAATFAVTIFIPCLYKTGRAQLPGDSDDGNT